MFGAPKFEVSWDKGKTWQESYTPCCGPGILLRIVAADGKILWQAHGIEVQETCESCKGTGIRGNFKFKEIW